MTETKQKLNGKYIETIGRRKTSTARVRLYESDSMSFVINDKALNVYFPTDELQKIISRVYSVFPDTIKFKVTAVIKGGGIHSQAEALRHGIARALVKYDTEVRKDLKDAGFLKRDPRVKERKKFGLKKARKAPQWSKR